MPGSAIRSDILSLGSGITIPPLCLLEIRFEALVPIRRLPKYHGAQWSAFFRHLLRPYLGGRSMADAEFWPVSVEVGVTAFERGEQVHVGLCFPAELMPVVHAALEGFAAARPCTGHFQPNLTLRLVEARCRICGQQCASGMPAHLTKEILYPEIDRLTKLDCFTLRFTSPLRLTRPAGCKEPGHRYCDVAFFSGNDVADSEKICALLARIRSVRSLSQPASSLRMDGRRLVWLDVSYGIGYVKNIGGIVGELIVAGRPEMSVAEMLVAGQYLGVGKNAAFGFGFYTIPELEPVRCIEPLARRRNGTTL
jgi:hypothetical protein